ncbi:MAG: hypothetical protein P8105_10685 [Dehalococcoidia bacterium]
MAGFTIPEAAYGINYIALHRDYSPEDLSIKVMFRVLPGVEVIPDSVIPGRRIAVKCTGFPAGDRGTLTFDGERIDTTFEVNTVGSFVLEFPVPEITAGEHTFIADSSQVYTGSASAVFNVVPDITVEPEYPDIGDTVTVDGCGFSAESAVYITFDEVPVLDLPAIDADGAFTATFVVPDTGPVDHMVLVEDACGNIASALLPLETRAPESPITIEPDGGRYGMFGAQEITFTWQAVSDPSGITYSLEIADNLNFFPLRPDLRRYDLTDTSCMVTLTPGIYFWRVKAVDGADNESEWSLSPLAFEVGIFPK